MTKKKTALAILFAIIMLVGAVAHVANPGFYDGFIPEPIPKAFANWAATFVEGAIGVALLIPRTRALAGLAFAALMVAFMPLHIWDAFKDVPAIGSHVAAIIRLFVQVLLIVGGWWIWRPAKTTQASAS